MATYKEIHGVNVQYRESDATAIEGDVWYNSSTGKLKMYSGENHPHASQNLTVIDLTKLNNKNIARN